MNIVVFGPPDPGREDVVERIGARLGTPAVTVASVFQAEVGRQTPAGAVILRFANAEEMVPPAVLLPIVLAHLDPAGFVLLGVATSWVPAEFDAALAGRGARVDRVVDLVLPDAEIARRCCGRRTCRGCGRIWHVELDPPAEPDRCDRCGGDLFQRDDDTPEALMARLRSYRSGVAPVLEHYRALGVLRPVDATMTQERIVEAALC
ncbi:adenylate kinase family protein [Dactylosporangium sp. NPDC000521]|uniref:adenylate kinase family protein n=1 Tax=Dactylosporangium sp. NPDC000521 TaxID=3363975 RepID=UPI0036BCF060